MPGLREVTILGLPTFLPVLCVERLMKSALPTLIVLGAGRGSRFLGGGHKLARQWQGATVMGHTVAKALASGLPVRVVTTEALLHLVTPQIARRDVVVLPEAQTETRLGMGYSIAAGVTASLDAAGWLVLPADMPMVTVETIRRIAAAVRQHPVAYPQHAGRRGHPVGFGLELAADLVNLTGDEGARRIVARYPALPVDVDDPGVLMDFDTEEDFQRAESSAPARPVAGAPFGFSS